MKNNITLIALIFPFFCFSQKFNFKITSKITGREVLQLNSDIIVDLDKKIIEYSTADDIYVGSVSYKLKISGVSFENDLLIANFNIDDPMYSGSPGKLQANLKNNRLQFIEWSMEGAGNSAVYTFKFKEVHDNGDYPLIHGEFEIISSNSWANSIGFTQGKLIEFYSRELFVPELNNGKSTTFYLKKIVTDSNSSRGIYTNEEGFKLGSFSLTKDLFKFTVLENNAEFKFKYSQKYIDQINFQENERIKTIANIETLISNGKIEQALSDIKSANIPSDDKLGLKTKVISASKSFPVSLKIDWKVVDSLLKINGKSKYDLPVGDLTLKSNKDVGIVIYNQSGEKLLLISETPFKKNIDDIEISVIINFTFSIFQKSDLELDQIITKYLLSRTNTKSKEAALEKIKKIKSVRTYSYLTINENVFEETILITDKFYGRTLGKTNYKFLEYCDGKKGQQNTNGEIVKYDQNKIDETKKSFGSYFWIPNENDEKVELIGVENQNNKRFYVLKSTEGSKEIFRYLNTEDFLFTKRVDLNKEKGKTFENILEYGNFQEQEGFIFHNYSLYNGKKREVITRYINQKYDESWFKY
jgi:hypothetical protein